MRIVAGALTVAVCFLATIAHAQQGATFGGRSFGEATFGSTTGHSNPAQRYFGTSGAVATPQTPRRPAFRQPPVTRPTTRTIRKPFENVTPQSNLSPYLSLDLLASPNAIPNYHAYVRPQLEQSHQQQKQNAQIQRLQSQVSAVNLPGAPAATNGVPTTGHSTQFMNVGGYYSQPQRR
ncbi:MAG: hypothetical protein RH917_04195 [Lacipirellulaceae bacterium]